MDKHVFILGAGFSVPLGGPLFRQLLTNELSFYWRTLSLEQDMEEMVQRVHDGVVQRAIGQELDAEQLIHKLDWMERNSFAPVAQKVALALGCEPKYAAGCFRKLISCLTHVVAAECELFLDEVEQESDLWSPYDRWFEELTPDDTVITFNYDTLVERIAIRCDRPYDSAKFGRTESGPRLIKLHGSANWIPNGNVVAYKESWTSHHIRLAIGTPGLTKSAMHNSGFFGELWEAARQAIVDANYVSIIGYSMPATDNNARLMILDALRKGRDHKRRVCVVLGDDFRKINRILAITRPMLATARFIVADTQMYAQDFIADFRTYSAADY